MKLLEHEAKKILLAQGIPIPKSFLASQTPEFLPVVVKSQVPTGGRGKAGGIIVARTKEEYSAAIETVASLAINGFKPSSILAEELLAIKHEYYLSLSIDKKAACVRLTAHTNGGIEVEDNDTRSYMSMQISKNTDAESVGQRLADYYNLPGQTFVLQDISEKLYKTFVASDALLIEINPLILTADDTLVAGDCKIELDDAALFRHPEWVFETGQTDSNFVTINPRGTVATIANGAGLAMATIDAVADSGLTPANFLDIGGGASEASVLAGFSRLVAFEQLEVIVVNIFAGITRCDEVAKAIIAAQQQIPSLPPLVVRLAGTNYEAAAKQLQHVGIELQPSLAAAISAAKRVTS